MCSPSAPKAQPQAATSTQPLRVLLSRQSLNDILIDPNGSYAASGQPTAPTGTISAGAKVPGMIPDLATNGGAVASGLRIVR